VRRRHLLRGVPLGDQPCPICQGSGEVSVDEPHLGGSAKIYYSACPACGGRVFDAAAFAEPDERCPTPLLVALASDPAGVEAAEARARWLVRSLGGAWEACDTVEVRWIGVGPEALDVAPPLPIDDQGVGSAPGTTENARTLALQIAALGYRVDVDTPGLIQLFAPLSGLELQRRPGGRRTVHDPLTGALTPWGLFHQDAAPLARSGPLAVALYNVTALSEFNRSYGHPAGDDLLRQFARRLVAAIGDRALALTRAGGDELAVLFPGMTTEEAAGWAQELHAAVEGPISCAGVAHVLRVRCGVSDGSTAGSLELRRLAGSARFAMRRGAGTGDTVARPLRSVRRTHPACSNAPWHGWRALGLGEDGSLSGLQLLGDSGLLVAGTDRWIQVEASAVQAFRSPIRVDTWDHGVSLAGGSRLWLKGRGVLDTRTGQQVVKTSGSLAPDGSHVVELAGHGVDIVELCRGRRVWGKVLARGRPRLAAVDRSLCALAAVHDRTIELHSRYGRPSTSFGSDDVPGLSHVALASQARVVLGLHRSGRLALLSTANGSRQAEMHRPREWSPRGALLMDSESVALVYDAAGFWLWDVGRHAISRRELPAGVRAAWFEQADQVVAFVNDAGEHLSLPTAEVLTAEPRPGPSVTSMQSLHELVATDLAGSLRWRRPGVLGVSAPQGSWLGVASREGYEIVDATSGATRHRHSGSAHAWCWSAHGLTLATDDGTWRLPWDGPSSALPPLPLQPRLLAERADGRRLAALDDKGLWLLDRVTLAPVSGSPFDLDDAAAGSQWTPSHLAFVDQRLLVYAPGTYEDTPARVWEFDEQLHLLRARDLPAGEALALDPARGWIVHSPADDAPVLRALWNDEVVARFPACGPAGDPFVLAALTDDASRVWLGSRSGWIERGYQKVSGTYQKVSGTSK
jgi:diguanylate cyclase (GGDEF)-like protein